MSEPPKILINGRPVQPGARSPHSASVSGDTEDNWALAPSAGIIERALAKLTDFLASLVSGVICGLFSIPDSLGYLIFLSLLIHMLQSPLHATPGKWLLGLRVVSTRGGSVNYPQAILRMAADLGLPFLVGLIGQKIPIPGLGLLSLVALISIYARPLFHHRRHAWHDTIAGTEVVRSEPSRILPALGILGLLLFVTWNSKSMLLSQLEKMAGETTQNQSIAAFAFTPADSTSENPCLVTPYCVTAYVTPWCPACEQSKPTLKRFQSVFNDGRVGVQIIMGHDTPEKIKAACVDYGSSCGVDFDRSISKSLKIKSFPTYLVWDTSSRKRIKKPRAVTIVGSVSDEEFKKAATEQLGLPSP